MLGPNHPDRMKLIVQFREGGLLLPPLFAGIRDAVREWAQAFNDIDR
jgi:hypothetical protein